MWTLRVLALVLLTSSCTWAQCTPGENCNAPDCRCWNDKEAPGNFDTYDIPQMVLVSFQYGLTTASAAEYKAIFEGIENPNGCEPKGTFFVQELNTEFTVVKELYDQGHEVGITSTTGKVPQSAKEWKDTFATMKSKVVAAGVPETAIQGTRAPELYEGGDYQFAAISSNNLTYDSTCVSVEYVQKDNLIWPYTYDFTEQTPTCTIGTTPVQKHPGKWQFLVADLEFSGHKCATPSGCSPYIYDSTDAFDLLYDAFIRHYDGITRAPFVVNIDPVWLTVSHQAEGTREFLEFVRAAYDDTWVLTNQQALAWIRDPVRSEDAYDFPAWSC